MSSRGKPWHGRVPFVALVTGSATIAFLAGALAGAAASSGPKAPPVADAPQRASLQRSSVSQHGITWEFGASHTVGQYANGDWWVVGPVELTAITPPSTARRNGENINPQRGDVGYDAGLGRMQRLDLPQTVLPGSSIVKGVSRTSAPSDEHRGRLQTAAVLTVVDQPPPQDGAIAFRPPYFGPQKPQYLTTDLRTDLLPALPTPGPVPPLEEVESAFARLQLDHDPGNEDNRLLHPVDNLADYGAKLALDSHFAALRLMLDDPVAEKGQALVNYVQYGIDLSAIVAGESHVCADVDQNCAGHGQGRTLPLVFAATLLDSQAIKDVIAAKADLLPENYAVTRTANVPTPLFGDQICSKREYRQVLRGGAGSRTCRDPYGHIDGGDPLDGYQDCCTSQPWKAAVTAMHLMPELRSNWAQSEELVEYVDRWVDFGFWTQPDPRRRFLQIHGAKPDGGLYRVELADMLWDRYGLSDRITTDWSVTLRIAGKRLRLSRGRATRVKLRCPRTEQSPPCRGRVALRTRARVPFGGDRRRVTLARGRFGIGPGASARVRLRLTGPEARLVRREQRAQRVVAIARVRDAAGHRAKMPKPLRIR